MKVVNKLVDSEIFTKDYFKYVGKGKGEKCILGAFIKYFPENIIGAEVVNEEYVCVPPLKGPKRHQLWGREIGKGYYLNHFVITNISKHLEATIRWIDEWFEEETSLQMHWECLIKI